MKKASEEKKFTELLDKLNNKIITLNEYGSVNYSYNDTSLDIDEDDRKKISVYEIKVHTQIDKNNQKKLHIDTGGYVGAAQLSNFIINVEPKFANICSLGRLIHYVNGIFDTKFLDERIDFSQNKNQLLYFHIQHLIHYTKKIIKEGLYKNYITVQEDSPYLKGKLLLLPTETTSGQILNDSRFNLQFSCEHDEFSANTLENQILLYTLEYCQRESPSPRQKMEIQRLIHEIDYDVTMPNSITLDEFEKLHYTSINQRYEPALDCCEKILSGFGFKSLMNEKTPFLSFFIKMNDLFQDFIACLLKNRKYSSYYVKADRFRDRYGKKGFETQKPAWDIEGSKKPIRPDIITYIDEKYSKIHAIIDAKYKDDEDDRLAESDRYQIAFYLNDYKKKIAYAVLPKHEKSQPDYTITAINQGLEIRVRHIDVEETLEWIFNKKIDDKVKVSEMLKEKFPL